MAVAVYYNSFGFSSGNLHCPRQPAVDFLNYGIAIKSAGDQLVPGNCSIQDFSVWQTAMTSVPAGISWLDGSRVTSDVKNIT